MSRAHAVFARWQSAFPALGKLASLPKPVLMAVAAGLVALVVVAILWLQQPTYKVLFSNISDKDGGKIVAELTAMNIPYQMGQNGTAILVPADTVHQTRMTLAEQGLPQGGNVGFELMENTRFGASQFAEQVTYQRAIEGELARSIEAMSPVRTARVHLAMPRETLFVREEKQPTASVLLDLHPGRSLGEGQVEAITWLVASSVPNLVIDNVSIVDQTGRLLSSKSASGAGVNLTQAKYTLEFEQRTISRVLSILTPVMGAGNVHAQVTAEMDFDQRESTSETFRPNQTPELAAVRSEQRSDSSQRGAGPAMGVPGALSNEPPADPQAPIALPDADANQAQTQGPSSSQNTSTVNYEVDRTVEHIKSSTGKIKRLSVAVVLNHRQNAEGQFEPLSEQEIEQVTALVRQAVGYTPERGDTISVANAVFNNVEPSVPLWKDPFYIDLGKAMLNYLLVAIILGVVWFKVIRPALARSGVSTGPAAADPDEDAAMNEALNAEALAKETQKASERYERVMLTVRELSKKDPRAAALVLREWMEQNKKGLV